MILNLKEEIQTLNAQCDDSKEEIEKFKQKLKVLRLKKRREEQNIKVSLDARAVQQTITGAQRTIDRK